MLSILNDLKASAELLKSLFEAKDWWALLDAAVDAAKKVKSLWDEVDGLFHSANPVEVAKAEAELDAALEALHEHTVFKFGAEPVTDKNDPKAIDTVTVITLISLVLDLIKKWREKK